MLALRPSDAARWWVPLAVVMLINGGIIAAVCINRALGNTIGCNHSSLPMITVVLENDVERLVALCASVLALPFNLAFAVGAWAVWRELGAADVRAGCSDYLGPCACALGGFVLSALIGLNHRSFDPQHVIHNSLTGSFVVCEGVFLVCTLRSLSRRMRSTSCPEALLKARTPILCLRWALLAAAGLTAGMSFGVLCYASNVEGKCDKYRRLSLYISVPEYAAVLFLVLQYVVHAFEFHLLRSAGLWSKACSLESSCESWAKAP